MGDTITYTITVTNSGNGAAEGILLTDAFSGAGELVWTSNDPTTTAFDVAAKSGDENTVVTFTATYVVVEADKTAGSITNSAVLEGEDEPDDPQTEVTVTAPNLTVAKSANKTEANVGDTITYTITVTNSGNADATNVRIYDGLDSKVEVTGATLNGKDVIPTVNNNAVYVNIGTLTPDSSVELVITATAKAAGIAPNKANVNSEETGAEYSNRVDTLIEDVVVKTITVTWIDGYTNGNIKQETINEGAAIPADPTAPDHESDGYRFTGWSAPVIDPVTGNITITANYAPIPADEKINVTWVDGYNGDILKELPGVYDKGTTTIPEDQYPSAPAHADYTFEQWTTQVLGNGDIIITANYRTLVVNPQGPTFEELTDLGITVEVVCETNATHGPRTETYPLMAGSYETIVANGSCTLIIYNDLYVEAYGGDHSLVGRPAQTIMLEYAGVPATTGDDETASDEIDDAASDTASEGENTDDVIGNNVDDDTDATTPDAGIGTGNENGIITDNGEETGNGDFAGDDSGEAGVGDDNGDANLPENGNGDADTIQLMSIDAISFSAPTGGWVIAQGYTNTVTFHVRCEEPVARTHTVTWVNWNGMQLDQRTGVPEDTDIPSSAFSGSTPTRPSDGTYTYMFSGWSAPSEDAAGNVTYTALFDRTPIARTHTVAWLDWNGTLLYQIPDVADGTTIPSSGYVGTTPTRLADAYNTYTFSGWSDPSVDRDGNVTYVAQYTPNRIPEEGPIVPVTPPVTPVTPVTPTPIPDNPTPLDPGTTIPDEEVPLAGAVGLNDVDHFAYIIGYDDDTVRPLNNITRAEVATIFFRLMTDEYRNANWSTSNSFSDVAAGSWYNNAISTCANAGALSGYTDGSFKPNASITRAEFAAIAARFLSDEYTDDGTGDFSDTANHWAAKEIRLAAKAGWVRGDGNKFRPNDYITRAEVMTIVNRMLDRIPDADHMLDTMKKWIDNPEDAWYYEAVQEATNEHAYERDEMGVVETWTEILAARDWAALEKGWADANAQ